MKSSKTSPSSLSSIDTTQLRDFRRNLRALEREIAFSLDEQSRCCGVSATQCHLLLELEAKGAASIGEFASSLDLDPSTLSRSADGLVKSELVSRADDPENRRRHILALKPNGHEAVYRINSLCDAYYAGLINSIPEEKRQTVLEGFAILAEAMMRKRKTSAPGWGRGKTSPAVSQLDGK